MPLSMPTLSNLVLPSFASAKAAFKSSVAIKQKKIYTIAILLVTRHMRMQII